MSHLRRAGSLAARLARGLVLLIAVILALGGIVVGVVETAWGKEQLRSLIVRQANQYLTATLTIGRLGGSLFRGLELGDVTLARDGHPIVAIEMLQLAYSPRELWQGGTVIRRVTITRPQIVAARLPDGRWDLGALVKRDARQQERTGPRRPIEVQSIELIDGSITLRDPFQFGPAHVSTEFRALNASFAFAYRPVQWKLVFDHVSWIGHAPELTVTSLSGTMGRDGTGWLFDTLAVRTPGSAFSFGGHVLIGDRPTVLDLTVHAEPFDFQEWAGMLTGLKNIAVVANFDTTLKGPLTALDTQLEFAGTGGSVRGQLTLDTKVPGWHGAGAVDVAGINLARWLNRPDRPSDITGHLAFDLDLDLGKRFPRGTYDFNGAHAMYMTYAANDLRAQGRLVVGEALIDRLSAVAYGAQISSTTGSIGLDSPYPYAFKGSMSRLDLRRVPDAVPVPHVESTLALNYDVTGSFSHPFITGTARFAPSLFLGASIADGMTGSIDTAVTPIRYSGEGDIAGVDLNHFGEGLDVGWLREPRYAGTIAGRFRVDGSGSSLDTLALTAAGRLRRGNLFHGVVSDADVSLDIRDGTLASSFNGRFETLDPAVAFADPRLSAALTGTGDVRITVHDLLVRDTTLADYDVSGRMTLNQSSVRELGVDEGTIEAALKAEQLNVTRLELTGPGLAGTGSGVVALNTRDASDFQYDVTRADLEVLRPLLGGSATGLANTKGRLTGIQAATRATGDGTAGNLNAFGISALSLTGDYDVTFPFGADVAAPQPGGRVTGRATLVTAFGQTLAEANGTVTMVNDRADFDLTLTENPTRRGNLAGAVLLHANRQSMDLLSLTLTVGSMPWRLVESVPPPSLSWSDAGFTITPVTFATGPADDQRIALSGDWRYDGRGALQVTARNAFLETLQNSSDARPARFGGVVDLDAVVSGTRTEPLVTGTATVSNGRIERVAYQRLAGRVDYKAGALQIDIRLDQGPGTWLTAKGTVPVGVFNPDAPDRPIDVAIVSSPIDLGLIAGVTDLLTSPTGLMRIDVRAVGTSRDPHFDGTIALENAGFVVSATGVPYKNGRAAIRLTTDRITVESLHLEDSGGRPLEVSGSLGTHELRVGDLDMDVTATRFEILRNDFGRLDINSTLMLRGRFEEPRLAGNITINSGGLDVDQILDRILFKPYSTEEVSLASIDAVAALNPWDRLGLDVSLRVPRTVRLNGTDIQVSPGTPVGLGDINLRVGGDLYLYKDPGQPLYITGSLDQVSGTYVFQGRQFQIDETDSSINFMGDLDPQIYVTVTREITGVETRVTLTGTLRQPELRLASTPPLDESDILSLIVFNTTPNALSSVQQQELAVRAGTLAAGFLATPLLQAVQNELGLEALEIEPGGTSGTGPRLTVSGELAPGLVARFSRQFGQDQYDEAAVEYYLSRLFRLRATFSDAQSLAARSTFRRVERAGIDLLVFFSF